MKALIVDDEPLARSRLARMLDALGGVRVVGEAGNGREALVRIAEEQPDVVFLDIRMPGMDGLEMAARLAGELAHVTGDTSGAAHPHHRNLGAAVSPLPAIVFTTAHHEHALEAFDAAAVDYLLKPVKRERLARAVARVRRMQQASGGDGALSPHALAAALQRALALQAAPTSPLEAAQHAPGETRICSQEGGDLHLFDARDITRFFASAKYTVFCHDGREHLVEESLSELERRLQPHGFFRCHRAELVNLQAVCTLRSDESGTTLLLRDGQQARVSRRLVADLKRALGAGHR